MEFITDPKLNHDHFKDIIRINYLEDASIQTISDYGYSYLMLVYGEIKAWNYLGEEVQVPRVLVKGTGDYFKIQAMADSSWLTFEMPNQCLHSITGLPAVKSRNVLHKLDDFIDPVQVSMLYDELYHEMNISHIAKSVDQVLGEYYWDWFTERPSNKVVNYILDKKGLLNVSDLLNKFAYTERSLERLFAKEVGASPNRFICLVRFNYVIRQVESGEYKSLQEVIYNYNYYDHSHFEKDFKRFLGQSMKEYKNEYNPLLTNSLNRLYHK